MSALGEKRQREEDISQEDILAILESSASDAPTLDPIGVKHLLLSFEKAVTSNRVQRVKHASEPLKYLESEVNLDLAIKSLHGLSAAPELYSVFLASGSLPTALDLLAHDNLDIASGVVDMLAELMDGGDEDTHQGHRDLIDSLRESGLELLAHVAVRFNASFVVAGSSTIDADDASRDTDALTTLIEFFSTILSIVPSISDSLCGVSGSLSSSFSATSTLQLLLGVLFSRLRARDFDACKEAAGELLFSLAGSSKSCSEVMGGSFYEFPGRSEKVSGVENILESLALYRKRAPSGKAEVELVENIVNTLCTCIVSTTPPFLIPPRVIKVCILCKTRTNSDKNAHPPSHHPHSCPPPIGPIFWLVRAVSFCFELFTRRDKPALVPLKSSPSHARAATLVSQICAPASCVLVV